MTGPARTDGDGAPPPGPSPTPKGWGTHGNSRGPRFGSRQELWARVDELLAAVHLERRAEHRPEALSGGEQQRVAIARALLNDPAIVLADEPTGNLDSKQSLEIWQLMRAISRQQGKTILMVTHEAQGAAFADRVIVLKDGRIVGTLEPKGSADAALVATGYQELAG